MIVAEYISQILMQQERSKAWLADKMDMNRQTMQYKMKHDSFTALDLLKMANVLGIDLNELKEVVRCL